jgi:hypothetical protein
MTMPSSAAAALLRELKKARHLSRWSCSFWSIPESASLELSRASSLSKSATPSARASDWNTMGLFRG